MTHHIDSPAFIANWRLLRVILQPDNMDQMEDMKRLLQQVLLLPAAAWCRLATIGVYRPPDCPSIVDRTSSIHSFFLPDVHPAFPLTRIVQESVVKEELESFNYGKRLAIYIHLRQTLIGQPAITSVAAGVAVCCRICSTT